MKNPNNKKVNVLYIINPELGAGSEMSLLEVAKCLDKRKYELYIGLVKEVSHEKSIDLRDFQKINLNLYKCRGFHVIPYFFRLMFTLWKKNIHIIHVNNNAEGNWGRIAAVIMRTPIVIDHWRGFMQISYKKRIKHKILSVFTDISFAVSESVKNNIARQYHLPINKFKVIYLGIDHNLYQSARPKEMVRQELKLPLDKPIVGIVSRLAHWGKGHYELFQALLLVRKHYSVHALVVGGGPRQNEIQKKAVEMGLQDCVHFVGVRRDIPDMLAAMDIFAIPSHSEGLCRALVEAMAAGLPVISSSVGGNVEAVRHEENGLLIPPKDPEALAAAILRMIDNPEWAATLGKKAADYVKEKFTLEDMAKTYNEVYDELVAKKMPDFFNDKKINEYLEL